MNETPVKSKAEIHCKSLHYNTIQKSPYRQIFAKCLPSNGSALNLTDSRRRCGDC
jgi:hypothetical protein